MNRFLTLALLTLLYMLPAALFILPVGCDGVNVPPPPQKDTVFDQAKVEFVLMVCPDVSGSYIDKVFGADAKVYRYLQTAVGRFRQGTAGEEARIVVGQIGAPDPGKPPLLWDGTPSQFNREFTASGLRQFVLQKSNPRGSRVYLSMADSLRYLARAYPDARKVCLVFSDGEDNVDTERGKRELTDALAEYGRKGGAIGVYGLSQGHWHDALAQIVNASPVKHKVVRSEIDQNPTLPEW